MKSRILFITPLPPPIHGSAMMSDAIRKSDLVNEEYCCDFVNLSTSRSMNEIGKFPLIKIWRFISTYFIVLWKLITMRYDLVYLAITVNGIGFLKDCPFVLMARLFCKKRLIHQHNKGMAAFAKRQPYRFLLKAAYKNAKVILLSWNLYEDISDIVSRDQVMICHNGIPMFEGVLSEEEKHDEIPELLYLSNLIEGKGVYVVLDACKILAYKGLKFHTTFVGGVSKQISAENFRKAVEERGLTKYVEYVGPKYGDEKEKDWNNADIFVFPTFYYNECFPLVLLEAMQHRVPVVSSTEGGICDIVENDKTGFLVNAETLRKESCNEMLGKRATDEEREQSRLFNPKRGQETAEALEKLLVDSELRKQMGEAGYERYNQLFTLEAFEKRMCECLRECMHNN